MRPVSYTHLYGGYLKLALQFPEFIDYIKSVCDEFRLLYTNCLLYTSSCVYETGKMLVNIPARRCAF